MSRKQYTEDSKVEVVRQVTVAGHGVYEDYPTGTVNVVGVFSLAAFEIFFWVRLIIND